MNPRTPSRPGAWAAAGLATLLLAACSTSTPASESSPTTSSFPSAADMPSVIATPPYYWLDDIAPNSPLESNPLVQTLRAADLGENVAWNAGDFTIKQLTDNVTDQVIATLAQDYSAQGENPIVAYSFGGWQPIEITRSDDTGGEVLACEIVIQRVDFKSQPPSAAYNRAQALLYSYTVVRENGELKVDTYHFKKALPGTCDASQAPVGIFDPAPTQPTPPVTKPVRAPLIPGWQDM